MKIEIKSRFDGRVLFAGEYASLKDAVIAAANSGSAYYCNGGWVRIGDRGEDASVMLVIEDAPSASTPIFDTDSEGVLT